MAVKFRNGEHHRNPSGFHNKVNYLLRESKRDLGKLYQIYGDIMYHRNGIDNKYFYTIKESWETAYIVAKWIIENNIDIVKDYLNSIYHLYHDKETKKIWYERICLK